MPNIISKIDIQLVIPPKMRGIFPNEKTMRIDFEAETPKEVPDYVAKYYTSNKAKIFRYEDAELSEEDEETEKVEVKRPRKFDPLEFLEMNYLNIQDALIQEERKNVIAVAEKLGLKSVRRQQTDRIIERIVKDIKIREVIKDEESGEE